MNGLTDVRLMLLNQELLDEQGNCVRHASAPSGMNRWQLMWHRLTTRRALRELDADQLKDIGLTPRQAYREGVKPFWRD
ncbi:MAG: DUF1127 domain-containing protein [Pseudomonas sp.]|uniref:DUF1127 domain-containing protein n=1 Tax=Pseudomonas abieticivorans TaxID=2931382 RepID=UPI0020BE2F60|nr:DUF1127 domain-containing protein [Pseudomonas sp. PIA16]MDE1168646.1 DUF1127 domain-containing protein [Pseudomonas sp.]